RVLRRIAQGRLVRFWLALGHVGPERELGVGGPAARLLPQLGVEPETPEGFVKADGRDAQGAHGVLGDHLDRLLRAARAPELGAQVALRLGPEAQVLHLEELAVEALALARGEELLEQLNGLVEALARLVLVDP